MLGIEMIKIKLCVVYAVSETDPDVTQRTLLIYSSLCIQIVPVGQSNQIFVSSSSCVSTL